MGDPVVTKVTGHLPTERTFTDRLVVRFPRIARIGLALGMRFTTPRS